jgi:hypothetical protein
MRMRFSGSVLLAFLFSAFCIAGSFGYARAQSGATPTPTYDDRSADPVLEKVIPRMKSDLVKPDLPPIPGAPPLIQTIPGYNYDDNGTYNSGYRYIPPDPIAASGPMHVVSIGNCMIQWNRISDGVKENHQSLSSFFSSVSVLGTSAFDPKVIYDQYENRFLVVALERWDVGAGAPSDESYILVAVSKTHDPNAGWWFMAINSKVNVAGYDNWADYPGFAVCDKAVYITTNLFEFSSTGYWWNGMRLWIIDKGVAGGFYSGGTPAWNIYDPYALNGGYPGTTQPTHMFGAVPANMGTFLTVYDGYTWGGPGAPEGVQVTRVDDPLGTSGGPFFNLQYPQCGDIEDVGGSYDWPNLPDAQQLGGPQAIEVNDRRTLNAVWRNNELYTVATINPNYGSEFGQTTAHWWRIDTSTLASVFVADQGDIDGEDLGNQTFTFFPSVAIDRCDNVAIGFSASNEGIYCGAYYTGRLSTDPPGTVQPTSTLAAGLDYYYRTHGGSENRWGDYSGSSLNPYDENTFWIFNEYADFRGTPIGGEDGRWTTIAGSHRQNCPAAPGAAVACPPDDYIPPGSTVPTYVLSGFTITNNSAAPMQYEYQLTTTGPGTLNNCNPNSLSGTTPVIPPAGSYSPNDACVDFPAVLVNATQVVDYDVWPVIDPSMTSHCGMTITIDAPLAVAFTGFEAVGLDNGVQLRWEVIDAADVKGYNVYRSGDAGRNFEKLNHSGLLPATASSYVDGSVRQGKEYTYRIGAVEPGEEVFSMNQSAQASVTAARLEQNWPNPFNPTTQIRFLLPSPHNARVYIYNAQGQLVRRLFDGIASPGENVVTWDGTNDQGIKVSSGVFYYKLTAGKYTETRKMVMVK